MSPDRAFADDTTDSLRATVRVMGLVRGQSIDKGAEVELQRDALVIAWHEASPWRMMLDGVDGVMHTVRECTIYLHGGDVLELTGDDRMRLLAVGIRDRACTMPELTRGLRSFGSVRGLPGAAHDAWFAPLLAARRAAQGVSDPARQLELLDAGRLAKAMTEAMAEIGALSRPGDPAAQRALAAALEDEAEGLFVALERLSLAAEDLRGSAGDLQIADWRRWVARLREVYAAADEAWGRVREEMAG
ncbi:MAG: hypothetical protein V4617_13375 [Gemmatimonadota bacterium]